MEKLRINSLGLYFGQIRNGLRLSIEASQIVGPAAKKNFVSLTEKQAREWFKGEDIEVKGDFSGFVIVKCNNDFLGTGRFKEGKVLNFVPKSRRLKV